MNELLWRGSVRGPAELGYIDQVQDLLSRASAAGVPPDAMMQFELAVVEVVGNAIKHAKPVGPDPVTLDCSVEARADVLIGTLREIGAAAFSLDLTAPPMPNEEAESGRGLALAGMLLSALDCRTEAGENRWTMQYEIVDASDSPT